MENKSFEIPETVCTCGQTLSGAFELAGATPSKDDFSVCLYCGELWIFNEDLSQRAPTTEESKLFFSHPDSVYATKLRESYKKK